MTSTTPSHLENIIEAALLVAARPLSVAQLEAIFEHDEEKPERDALLAGLETLKERYEGRGIELREVASGWRLQSRQEMSPWIGNLFQERSPRYSRALLETLVLVAYRQPITRGEVEDVRGVAVSTNIIKTLLEREWVKVVGHRDVPGRPALYATTKQFLDYFNLKKIGDLPTLSEIKALDEIAPDLAKEVAMLENQASEGAESDQAAGEGDEGDQHDIAAAEHDDSDEAQSPSLEVAVVNTGSESLEQPSAGESENDDQPDHNAPDHNAPGNDAPDNEQRGDELLAAERAGDAQLDHEQQGDGLGTDEPSRLDAESGEVQDQGHVADEPSLFSQGQTSVADNESDDDLVEMLGEASDESSGEPSSEDADEESGPENPNDTDSLDHDDPSVDQPELTDTDAGIDASADEADMSADAAADNSLDVDLSIAEEDDMPDVSDATIDALNAERRDTETLH